MQQTAITKMQFQQTAEFILHQDHQCSFKDQNISCSDAVEEEKKNPLLSTTLLALKK